MKTKNLVTRFEELEALYGKPKGAALEKEAPQLTPEYRRWIEAAPFVAMASLRSGRLDCSPRGDEAGQLMRVLDEKTIVIPDRPGNKRLDTLRNLVEDPRIALMFLIPGINECVRIMGEAVISTSPELISMFDKGGKIPVTVLVITINAVFFQCGRALLRSQLWNSDAQLSSKDVPTAGEMIRSASPGFDAEAYDANLPGRQKASL